MNTSSLVRFTTQSEFETARERLRRAADEGCSLGKWASQPGEGPQDATVAMRDELAMALDAPNSREAVAEWVREHAADTFEPIDAESVEAFADAVERGFHHLD